MTRAPRLFPDRTVVCIASGPSLTREDVEACRGQAPVIAINDVYRWAPWADVLYACDKRWWEEHDETRAFAGLKFGLQKLTGREDVQTLQNTGEHGLEREATGVRTGKNSGYQAINLAVHLGATRILLLGYDMQPAKNGQLHFFGSHRWTTVQPPFAMFLALFETLRGPLHDEGVTVVNCTRRSALTCFPCQPLAEALRG